MNTHVRLTAAFQIGFSGHRKLSHEKQCEDAIRSVLSEWNTRFPGGISGLSSTASGGDLLFAEACLALGIPVRILLPLPPSQFKDDFGAEDWRRVESVLDRSSSFEVIAGGMERPECYHECGLETIHQCNLLIVLWNGLPAQGPGGTGDMALHGRDLEYPVIWIHSETGKIEKWNIDGFPAEDQVLASLNDLPDYSVKIGSSLKERALAWFIKLDENANQAAPQVRKIVAIPILCTGAASLLTASADIFRDASSLFLGISAALGLVAFFAPKILKAKQKQERRTTTRAAAEISRSFVALWDAPMPYDVVSKAELADLEGMVRSLNHLKILSGFRPQPGELAKFKKVYRKDRIEDQADFFSRQSSISDQFLRRARKVILCAILFSVGGNLFVMASKTFHFLPTGPWTSQLGLGIALALQVASSIGAMIVINDYARRKQRYAEMGSQILHYGKQLEQARTWAGALRIVTKIERSLLMEVIEWRTVFKNQKFGK